MLIKLVPVISTAYRVAVRSTAQLSPVIRHVLLSEEIRSGQVLDLSGDASLGYIGKSSLLGSGYKGGRRRRDWWGHTV